MSQTYRTKIDRENFDSVIKSSQEGLAESLLEKRDESSSLNLEIPRILYSKNGKKLKIQEKSELPSSDLCRNQPLKLDAGTADYTKKLDAENFENNLIFNLSKKNVHFVLARQKIVQRCFLFIHFNFMGKKIDPTTFFFCSFFLSFESENNREVDTKQLPSVRIDPN